MLELYTHPMSPCAQKVRVVLAEKRLEWVAHHVNLQEKENLKAEYLRLNPLGVVPTLVYEGRPVIESSIICEFIDDGWPDPPLKPRDIYLRAQMRYWMKHVDVKLHAACGTLQWPMVMRPNMMEKSKDERDALLERIPEKPRRERQKRLIEFGLEAPDVVDAVRTYRSTILDMEEALARGSWVVGDNFSLADVCLAPYFQTLLQFDWTALYDQDCPRVTDWFQRCQERTSFQIAVTDDFSAELMTELRRKGAAVWEKIAAHVGTP